jgi:hypothetical protein
VALKLLASSFSANPVFRERLFREASTAGRFNERENIDRKLATRPPLGLKRGRHRRARAQDPERVPND